MVPSGRVNETGWPTAGLAVVTVRGAKDLNGSIGLDAGQDTKNGPAREMTSEPVRGVSKALGIPSLPVNSVMRAWCRDSIPRMEAAATKYCLFEMN